MDEATWAKGKLLERVIADLSAGRAPAAVDVQWLDENIGLLLMRLAARSQARADRQILQRSAATRVTSLLRKQLDGAHRTIADAQVRIATLSAQKDDLAERSEMLTRQRDLCGTRLLEARRDATRHERTSEDAMVRLTASNDGALSLARALDVVAAERGRAMVNAAWWRAATLLSVVANAGFLLALIW